MHRALQRSILNYLDQNADQHEVVFDQALRIIRQAFPRGNAFLRHDSSNLPIKKIYLPNVIMSPNTAFCAIPRTDDWKHDVR
jgi:hypothetical protein